ncbi:MAG: putative dual-specificity RNA methyltransferase RlmN [Gemmatimonadales bacterium]|nr:MAG: putative dual-specificity RNA methyltransferase RlmN [Gemmatimonadales bacterium]
MNLLDLAPEQAAASLRSWLEARGEPGYRIRQILPRLWEKPVRAWAEATDLPLPLRSELDATFPLPRLALDARQVSRDGTVKYLWRLEDGLAVESVLIPEGKRRTLCISSQVGCAFGCIFCATGTMGFQRNLACWEIACQVREVVLETGERPTNVVFMGMGEPLHNWEQVDRALTILNSPSGFGIGARHITVSTVGLLPGLSKLAARKEQFRLAISLHAATHQTRLALMPVERKYDLDRLMKALEVFERRVTFEYIVIRGRNDSPADAEALAALARPLKALVNLIPLHPGGAVPLPAASAAEMAAFARRLRALGVSVSVRKSRGLDISAACGQLRVEVERARRVRTQEHGGVQQQLRVGLPE